MKTPPITLHKPRAAHLGVSVYPQHFKLLDALCERYGGVSRSRMIQYLIESASVNTNTNREDPHA